MSGQVRKATGGLRGKLAEGFEWASRKGKAVFEGQGKNAPLSSEDGRLSGFECSIYEILGDVKNGGLRMRLWTVLKARKFGLCLTPEERHPHVHTLPSPVTRVTVSPRGPPLCLYAPSSPLPEPLEDLTTTLVHSPLHLQLFLDRSRNPKVRHGASYPD